MDNQYKIKTAVPDCTERFKIDIPRGWYLQVFMKNKIYPRKKKLHKSEQKIFLDQDMCTNICGEDKWNVRG